MPLDFSKAYQDRPNERREPPQPAGTTSDGPQGGGSIYEQALTSAPQARPDDDSSGPPSEEPGAREQRPASGPEGADGAAPKGDGKKRRRKRKRRERRHDGEAAEAKRQSERLEVKRHTDVPESAHAGGAFREFDLTGPVLQAIEDMGWQEPSEIQRTMIPKVLMGRDIVGQARTGTGKTGAFAIPLVERYRERIDKNGGATRPAVLALTPTRELALQIDKQFQQLGAYAGIRSVCVYGGAPLEPQLRALRAGADVVVGTPGRIMDHMRRRSLRLDDVSCFVLDEADRMFDLGFRDDIYWIARHLPDERRQTLLLSATVPSEVLELAKEVTRDPEVIRTASEDPTVNTVEQFAVSVDPERKLELLAHLVSTEDPEKGIVFTRTRRGADKVAERLRKKSVDATEIHSDLRQKRREQVLESFREGDLHVLVATDVAARGLDIQGVTHIFNFDIPSTPDDYVHRVGRTARMGRTGRAFTFITDEDGQLLTQIEKTINKQIPGFDVEGFRCRATDEEKARRTSRTAQAEPHPMSEKFSPALMSILNRRKTSQGPRGRGGPPPGGGKAGGKGGRGPGGKGGRGPGGKGRKGGRGR